MPEVAHLSRHTSQALLSVAFPNESHMSSVLEQLEVCVCACKHMPCFPVACIIAHTFAKGRRGETLICDVAMLATGHILILLLKLRKVFC